MIDIVHVNIEHCSMSPSELRSALQSLGLSQAEFAKLVGVTPRAVSLWLSNEREIPGPLAAYARLLLSLPLGQREAEFARLGLGAGTLQDGMYRLKYSGPSGLSGEAMLVFEGGRIFGTDAGKSRYDGSYASNPKSGQVEVRFRVELRAGEKSVVGPAQPFNWILEAWCDLRPRSEHGEAVFNTNIGADIRANYEFMRPLPST